MEDRFYDKDIHLDLLDKVWTLNWFKWSGCRVGEQVQLSWEFLH